MCKNALITMIRSVSEHVFAEISGKRINPV